MDKLTLPEAIAGWAPGIETSAAVLDLPTLGIVADVLDSETPSPKEGDPLPALWHWPCFSSRAALSRLGQDGHPRHGAHYPPIPRRRRMFVGGRLSVLEDLRVGWGATVRGEVVDQQVKQGRSGEMLFVTVRRSFAQGGATCVVEEQDIMYRSGEGTAVPAAPEPGGIEEPVLRDSWSGMPQFTTPKLFSFSAITCNAHRIHYDIDYARSVEGYPGLVVHGPLLILSMLEVVRRGSEDRPVSSVSYTLRRPVICGDRVLVKATPTQDHVQVVMRSDRHGVVASADVVLR